MEFGRINIKLDEYLKTHNISRSSLSRKGELRYDTILTYCNKTVTRLDIETLAKICATLNCNIQDILEFEPNISKK
ncbi:MAG: helix-turn-helix transcriptional regulator [Clostridia bacterium]|jgi:putative transcriptional regulator|nr:helix-turn-helix transcriptional regulator [Clostridia bacterium]